MTTRKIRWVRITLLVLAVLLLSSATTFVIWPAIRNSGSTVYLSGANQTRTKALEKLERFRQGYATARSVHIAADAKIILYGANFRVGNGSYEYWADGDRYKIKCHTDTQLGFLKDVDIAYNGERFYFFDRGSGILSYQHQDISKTIGALPNPLFMPVDFLSSEDDSCPFCALRMSDFKSTNTRWYDRASSLEVKSQVKDQRTGYVLTDLEMPGGTKARRPFKIVLRMAEAEDGKVRLIRINQVGLDEKLLTSVTFDDFVPSALGEFPRTINVEGFDETSNLIFRMVYTVNKLEIDQYIEKGSFAIGFDEAEAVWDSDARKFVKEKRSKPSPR